VKRLACPACASRVYFDNLECQTCGTALAFLPAASLFVRADQDGTGTCTHRMAIACNWATDPGEAFCRACALNNIVPNLGEWGNGARWQRIETAKRRFLVDLLRLGLPILSRQDDAERGLAFDFLSNRLTIAPVRTGHLGGLITMDIAEADDAEREGRRAAMGEPYRTLIGHFRHEIAHYYFSLLIEEGPLLNSFRAVFGNATDDYDFALANYYTSGPRADWQNNFISAYASSHPWEDWAETFAHFLHIVSTLDTAIENGFVARIGRIDDPYREADFDGLIQAFRLLTEAVNEINRSMGVPDVYPFVLTPTVVGKLHFVHIVVTRWAIA
jgi:hypothetical protein